MIRIFMGAAAALVLGVLTAFAALPPQDAPPPDCSGCMSGIANWHPVLPMTDSNGNKCDVILTIWRQDGTCVLKEYPTDATEGDPYYDCIPDMPCGFMIQSQCTCGTACQHIYVSMYTVDGTLVFSMPSQGVYIVGMPCDSLQWVTFVAHNTLTGQTISQLNGFSCSECVLKPAGGGSDAGGG